MSLPLVLLLTLQAGATSGFSHATHADAGLGCDACHAGIAQATALDAAHLHLSLPAEPSKVEACRACHEADPAPVAATRAAPFAVRLDHARHAALLKDCRGCHQRLPEPGDAATPSMAACTACHRHQQDFAAARCTPCHVDPKGLTPQTALAHGKGWGRTHGDHARTTAETCAQCHDVSYCATCHGTATAPTLPEKLFPEQVDRFLIHRGDYLGRHALEASANPASCRRCHGSASCAACHAQQGVAAGLAGAVSPHTGNFNHGREGRRDIARCAACHDNGAATVCVSCHRVGGSGGNPHPLSFTRKHKADDVRRNAMCRTCHTA